MSEQTRASTSTTAFLNTTLAEDSFGGSTHAGSGYAAAGRDIPRLAQPALPLADVVRRTVDLICSGLLLIITLPVMVVLAILIRLDSPGPVVFRQRRLGTDAVPFNFYKFRTMLVDARERFPELYAYRYSEQEVATMRFKLLEDPRLTRVGRWLRRTSLDELPNLFNVLRGDMTLVGPRPELPEMLRYYTDEQLIKFAVKPGVTGLAQVSGRGVLRFQETLTADVTYCRRRSLWFDFVIALRTIKAVFLRIGAF